jgi:2-polyprenyl-6-methoxyphenol hydroxylase-like FAD-dependent oxidoreductase
VNQPGRVFRRIIQDPNHLIVDFEVAIIGGGPAGAAAALALAQQGRHACLIEALPVSPWKIGETLAPEARSLLQSFGVWEEFLGDGHLPSPGICSAWGSDHLVEKDFIFNPHGCGWQLDRARFETMLLKAAQREGASVVRGEAVQDCHRASGGWEIVLASQTVRAPWMIDATGRRSMMARKMGMPRAMRDQLVSIYVSATSAPGLDEDARTLIESRPEGWWYTALTPNGRRTVAFQPDAELIRAQEWRDPAWLEKMIGETRCLSALLAGKGYRWEGPPQLTSAHSGRLEQCCGVGWLAVGDAAQSFDPLSGQGVLSALITGQMAADALGQSWPNPDAAVTEYGKSMEARWTHFLSGRQQFYAFEPRWPDAPFWQGRRGIS